MLTICLMSLVGCAMTNPLSAQILSSFTEPHESVRLSIAEPGRVAQVHVKLGDRVEKGDLILSLDNKVYELAKRIAETKATADGEINYAEAELKLKTSRYEKLKSVQSSGHAGVNELDLAATELEAAKARLQSALDVRQHSQLEVLQIEAQIEQRLVRSSIDGVIVEVYHKPGEYVSVNEPVTAVVANLSKLRAKFYLLTEQARSLSADSTVDVVLQDGTRLAARVEYVSPITSAKSLTVRVDVIIPNEQNQNRSGVPIRIDFPELQRHSSRSTLDLPAIR
jgi:RND family efflux transporter MFP subunit